MVVFQQWCGITVMFNDDQQNLTQAATGKGHEEKHWRHFPLAAHCALGELGRFGFL